MNTEFSVAKSGMIGPYRVVTTIGVGGMGQVLKVEDTRTGQYLALKIHYSPVDKETVQLHYLREHRAMARCDHPNVIRTYGNGVHEGCPYLVMDFVDGVSLTDFLESRDLASGPERDKMAALLGIQIASALEHIHSRNLVHLDLKPANILVTRDETVKLIDFGIARELEQDQSSESSDAVGTFAFCSPEQVTGVPCDHRSDLYSFGVVLYLLLTDHLPFVAEQAIAYILKHVSQPPEPPESYYPGIPFQLRDILLKLLEKKPSDRPQSGHEVARLLRNWVEGLAEGRATAASVATGLLPGPSAGVRLFEPAFIGREKDRRLLDGAVSLLQAGVGGLNLITGEIGQGKGRLMDEVLADARARGVTVFSARCVPDADRPYQGMLELVEGIVAYLIHKEVNLVQVELGAYLPILARAFPPVTSLLPAHSPQAGDAAPHVELERLQVALKAFLDAVLPGPTILALRELQWADEATLNLISAVGLREPDARRFPILFLCSAAVEELEEEHPIRKWQLDPKPLCDVLPISPLSVEEVGALINSMLGGVIDLGQLVQVLHRETRGNPFFVAEAIRLMVDRGDLLPQGYLDDEVAGWNILIADEKALAEELAHSFRAILVERVALLPEATRRLLEFMAVLDRPCSYPWLRLVNPVAEDELLDMLDDVMARRLVVEKKGRRHSMFSFRHPGMAEAVRQRIEHLRLVGLHRIAGEAWLKIHGDEDIASLELIATHLFKGEAYQKAAPSLLRAAEERFKLGLFDSAMKLLEFTLEASRRGRETDPRIGVTAHLRLGQVMQYLSRPEKALDHLRTASSEAEENGFQDLQGEGMYALARMTGAQGDYVTSCTQYTEALKLLRASQDGSGVLRVMNGLAESLWYLGDLVRAKRLFTDALGGAKMLVDSGLSSYAIHGLGLVAVHEGALTLAAKHFVEAANLSRTSGRDAFYLRCQRDEADTRRMMGDLEAAGKIAEQVATRLEQVGEREDIAGNYTVRAAVAIDIRDLKRAESLLQEAARILQHVPHHYVRATRRMLFGQLELARGRPVEAQMAFGEVLDVSEFRQYRELAARAQRYLGAALIQSGSMRDGILMVRRAISSAEKLSHLPGAMEARLFYAEGLLVRGDREEALEVLARIKTSFKEAGLRLLLVRTLALMARISADARKAHVVKAHVEEALRHVREIRNALSPEERRFFDTRPEIRLLFALRRSA